MGARPIVHRDTGAILGRVSEEQTLADPFIAFRRVEVRRYRAFAGMVALSVVTTYAIAAFLDSDPLFHRIHLTISAPCGIYAAWFLVRTRDIRRYASWMGEGLAYICLAQILTTLPVYGPFSFVVLFVPLGFFVYCQGDRVRVGIVLLVFALPGLAILGFGQVRGGWTATSLIGLYDGTSARVYANTALVCLISLLAFVQSRLVRRTTRGSLDELDDAARDIGVREAIVAEARDEIDRAMRRDQRGRFTGQTIGGYRLGSVLGRGAMGEVYDAQTEDGTPCAIKVLQSSAVRESANVEAFFREAEVVRTLDVRHVVKILDCSAEDTPIPCIVMERLRGQSLSEILRARGRLTLDEVLGLVHEVALGLEAAHQAGVVHCDLKPANIFRHREDDGETVWKVLDFGASHRITDGAAIVEGRLVGTPAYMAPEQFSPAASRSSTAPSAEPLSAATDVYALGIVAYRALTGRPAFGGAGHAAMLYSIANHMPSAPQALGVEDAVSDVIALAIAKRAEDRWATPRAFAESLYSAAEGTLPHATRRRARTLLHEHPWGDELRAWMLRNDSLLPTARRPSSLAPDAPMVSAARATSAVTGTQSTGTLSTVALADQWPPPSRNGHQAAYAHVPSSAESQTSDLISTALDVSQAGNQTGSEAKKTLEECAEQSIIAERSAIAGASGVDEGLDERSESSVASLDRTQLTTTGIALRLNELRNLRMFAKLMLIVLFTSGPIGVFLGGHRMALGAYLGCGAVSAAFFIWFLIRTHTPQRYQPSLGVAFGAFTAVVVSSGIPYWGGASAISLFIPFALCTFAQGTDFRAGFVFYALCHATWFVWGVLRLTRIAPNVAVCGILSDHAATDWAIFFGAQAILALSYIQAKSQRQGTETTFLELEAATRTVAGRQALVDEFRAEIEQAVRVGGPGAFSDHVLGSYRLGNLIGRGGMGDVYEATHTRDGSFAATKLMNASITQKPSVIRRFLRESRLIAKLNTPNVVRILELPDAESPIPFITMERLAGETLSQRLRRAGTLTVIEAQDMLRQVGAGVAAAHATGIVHRDLKPANLFLHQPSTGEPVWKVLDFGVSKSLDTHATQTQGGFLGTPAYVPPEQVYGMEVDARNDVYALGVVLYRALTGRLPFTGEATEILHQVLTQMPAAPSSVRSELPTRIDEVVLKALAKEKKDRFAGVAELVRAFEQAAGARKDAALAERNASAEG